MRQRKSQIRDSVGEDMRRKAKRKMISAAVV